MPSVVGASLIVAVKWLPIVIFLVFVPVGVWILLQGKKDAEMRRIADEAAKNRALEAERARRMVTPELDVEQAQKVVWAWEEMTEQERAALPLEQRVEFRAVREAFEEHKRQHPDLHR